MGGSSSKPIPQPTINSLDADVPIIPPIVCLALLALSFILGKKVTRYRWLPDELASLRMRLAIAAAMMAVAVATMVSASDELHQVNSGVAFTPVGGIAKTCALPPDAHPHARSHVPPDAHPPKHSAVRRSGLYAYTRNPLYLLAVFVQLPMLGVAFDSAWLVYSAFALFVYLQMVVIPGEEAFLLRNYGEEYATYLNSTPRWLLPDSN